MWDAPDVVPSITYKDVPRAVEWLSRVFGFEERAAARLTWPGGCIAWIEIGDCLLSLSTPDQAWADGAGADSLRSTTKVYVDDVDAHFRRAKSEGATIVLEPEDGFWGGRIYRALDLEGNRWELSQRGRDLSAEQWRLPDGLRRGVLE